jgi:pimeloyl-ACP methyl ester carboxylesterase
VLDALHRGVRRYLVMRGVRASMVELLGHAVHHYQYRGTGRGPPVVLVHGLAGSANGFFRTLPALGARFRDVHAFDFPGNGFSPTPPSGPLALPELEGVLVSYCEEVVRAPAFVVGNSMGGAMAAVLAGTRPDLVRALGLVSPAGAQVAPERQAETLRSLQVHDNRDARRLIRRLFHRAPLPALLFAGTLRRAYGAPSVQAVFSQLAEGAASILEPSLLAGLRMPVLLLWGGSEKLLPFEGIDYFRAHLPAQARIEVVEGFGHSPQVERPSALVRRLVAFADEVGLES